MNAWQTKTEHDCSWCEQDGHVWMDCPEWKDIWTVKITGGEVFLERKQNGRRNWKEILWWAALVGIVIIILAGLGWR